MTGEEQARATAEKLKVDKTVVANKDMKIEAITDKTGIKQMDPDLMAMMKSDAQKQTEEDGGLQPWLKVFDASRSTYSLRDGGTPQHGWFFYQPEENEREEVYAHILHLSRGFRAEGMKSDDGKVKYPYQHIVSGVMIEDGRFKLFWMTIAGGARLNRLWDFRKEFQKKSRSGISKWALVIHLTTERVTVKDNENKDRVAQVINFNFVLDENNNPNIVQSKSDYMFLKEKAEEQKQLVEAYIARREVIQEQPIKAEVAQQNAGQLPSGVRTEGDKVFIDPHTPNGTEEVNVDDIPF